MDFEYNGFVLETFDDNSTTIVSINDKDISIEIRYPMRISTADMQIGTKLNRFYNVYDIKLKDMVGLGRDILDYENAFYFLENITIGLMSINDDVPFTGMLIECGTDTWYIDDIKKEIQLMLLDTFSEIRVGSTDHFPFEADASIYADYEDYGIAMREAMDEVTLVDNFDEPDDYENALMAAMGSEGLPDAPLPPDAYYYFHYFMDLDEPADNEYQNFSVDFLYFPEFGMDIQAEPSSDGILKSNDIEGFRKYLSFFCINQYHFVYDINYPVIVNMHDPDALKGQGFTFRYAFPVLIRNNEGLRSRQYMDYAKSNSGFDNYCLDDNGRKVLIRVYDQSCGSGCLTPVADVNITMLCANKKCPLGVTDDSTGVALLRTNLTSSCANPYLVAEKEGYLPGYYLLETDTEERINLDMIELKNFSVELKSHKLDTVFNTMGSAESVTGGMANVYVSTVIDDIPYDDSFIIFADQESIIQIPVVSAEYDLSVTYLKNDIDFSGGYYSSWNVTRAELADGNEITFHFIEMLPSTLEEDAVEAIGLINNMTRSGLDPEIN